MAETYCFGQTVLREAKQKHHKLYYWLANLNKIRNDNFAVHVYSTIPGKKYIFYFIILNVSCFYIAAEGALVSLLKNMF